MRISALRSQVRADLVGWAWGQWAQMGVSAGTRRQDRWAADPEALLLFTLEIARADARLFDELLDWLALNERLVSVQRLRNLCGDVTDRSLVDAAVAWTTKSRSRIDTTPDGVKGRRGPRAASERLFRDLSVRADRVDETFRAQGWLKPATKRSGKSQPPNTLAPINFAFRLRQILGIGARAEVVRFLLTVDAPRATAQTIAASAGYAKRNVHEALTTLHEADVIDTVPVGNELRYGSDRERWAALLGLGPADLPLHRDWLQLLSALRRLSRWLEDREHDAKSEYMLASDARVLADEVTPDLRYAGVRIDRPTETGAEYWQDFVALVEVAVAALDAPLVSNGMSNERRRTTRTQPSTAGR